MGRGQGTEKARKKEKDSQSSPSGTCSEVPGLLLQELRMRISPAWLPGHGSTGVDHLSTTAIGL